MKYNKSILIGLVLTLAMSCSHQASLYSTRDLTLVEKNQIKEILESKERVPSDEASDCITITRRIVKKRRGVPVGKTVPVLKGLESEKKVFPNGKEYDLYRANIAMMQRSPEYQDFLDETAEVLFESVEPFGHIRLRVGRKVYAFNNVQWTSISDFSPRMYAKSTSENMPSAQGFIFEIDKAKLEQVQAEIQKFYNSSSSHNIPPFDAYSPLVKIEQRGSGLQYVSPSPKYANNGSARGTIIEENGEFYLKAENGLKMAVVKDGNDFYTQSYSCASSAGYVLENFFGIRVSYSDAAKGIEASLSNGNIGEKTAPIAIMRYYEDN